jgi:hypothetical protein
MLSKALRFVALALVLSAGLLAAPSPSLALGKSNYLEDKLLNWLKGTAFGTAPTAIYVALSNGDPTDADSGGTDVTTTLRTAGRVSATFGTILTTTTANTMCNSGTVDFGAAAAGATITHFKLYDAATAGNMLYSNALTGGSQAVSAGTNVSFTAGSLCVTEE